MPPQLVALTEGPNILLDKPIVLLGRHQECDIQLASRKISRRHCCIAQVHDYLVIRDLCSTNGIRINGVRVNEGSLRAGDELTIGNTRYQLQWGAHPAAPAPSAPPRDGRRPTRSVDDDELDSCDEPVPLEEPGAPEAIPLPRAAPVAPGAGGPPRPPNAPMLPEDLDLAPLSDPRPSPPDPAG